MGVLPVTTVWLATKHAKGDLMAPVFVDHLGWDVREVEVDTDQWGTFTPETPRVLSPRDAALEKARHAVRVTGGGPGLGSEGTVGSHPVFPLVTSITEHIALVDPSQGLEIVHHHTSTDIVAVHTVWRGDIDRDEFVRLADLPHHAVIVRAASHPGSAVKGIRHLDEVINAVAAFRREYPDDDLVVESDFRAMMSPSRQRVIAECAKTFAEQLSVRCPTCDAPYWGVVDRERGLPCLACGLRNEDAIRADVWGCWRCDARESVAREVDSIDPSRCNRCNP
jgi:hypothetical protein